MSARWWTFVTWALVAASALFWGLKLLVKPPALPSRTPVAAAGLVRGDLQRLLGVDAPPPVAAAAPEPVADARFQLIGVVSPRSPQAAREGLALIAVDGKPAKTFRVGAVVDGQTVLKSVGMRMATLGPSGGGAVVALNLAPPPAAATSSLPPSGLNSSVPTAVPMTPQALGPTPLPPPTYVPPSGQTRRARTQTQMEPAPNGTGAQNQLKSFQNQDNPSNQ